MAEQPLHEFTSHVDGKNAKVRVFPDRVEWERPRGLSRAKLTTAVFTAGLSVAATGVKSGKGAWEVIPIRGVTSVSAQRDGFSNSLVRVTSAGGEVSFRVSHKEAEVLRSTLLALVSDAHAPHATVSGGAVPSVVELAELHAAGHLTDDEFAAAKAKALGL